MSGEIPPASTTKELVLSSGVTEEVWDAKVKEFKQRFGNAIATEDFLCYQVARVAFGVEMPQISTLGKRGQRGPTLELKLRDVTADYAKKVDSEGLRFKFNAWVFNQRATKTKKDTDKIRMVLTDGEYAVDAAVSGDKPSAKWREYGIKDGDLVTIDGADMSAWEGRASLGVGFAEVKKVEPQKSIYDGVPDAGKSAVPPGGVGRIKGFVTAEENRGYKACMVCGTGEKKIGDGKGRPCCKTSARVENFFRSLTVTDGTSRFTLSFPPAYNPPKETTFFGRPMEAVGVYSKDNEEYTALVFRSEDQVFVKKHTEVFNQAAVKPAGTPSGIDEVFTSFLKNQGEIPEVAIVRTLKKKMSCDDAEAKRVIEERIKKGDVLRKPDGNLAWVAKAESSNGTTPTAEVVSQVVQKLAEANGGETTTVAILEKFADFKMLAAGTIEKMKAEGIVYEARTGVIRWVG